MADGNASPTHAAEDQLDALFPTRDGRREARAASPNTLASEFEREVARLEEATAAGERFGYSGDSFSYSTDSGDDFDSDSDDPPLTLAEETHLARGWSVGWCNCWRSGLWGVWVRGGVVGSAR